MARTVHVAVAALVLATALAGCIGSPPTDDPLRQPPVLRGPARASSAAEAPLVVALELADPGAFFGNGTSLTLSLDARGPHGALRYGVALPAGVEAPGAALEGSADGVNATFPLRHTLVVRALAAGPHVLRGWAEADVGGRSRIAPSAELRVEGVAGTATAVPQPPGHVDVQVTVKADAADARKVTASVTSPVAADAKVRITLPTALRLAEGNLTWEGRLAPGTPRVLALEVAYPAEWPACTPMPCYFELAADAHLDPAVFGGVASDSLYYRWDGRSVAALEELPREPRGSETPPSCASPC